MCLENPSAPAASTSSFCMYDFGVLYLLDDHKQALNSSLHRYLSVVGTLPLIPDGDYQGHRSLVSSATCKSLSDLPDTMPLITGATMDSVGGFGVGGLVEAAGAAGGLTGLIGISGYGSGANVGVDGLCSRNDSAVGETAGAIATRLKTSNDGAKGTSSDLYCASCQLTFRSLAQLKAHRRAHQGEKPFSCTLCHTSFSTKSQLLG